VSGTLASLADLTTLRVGGPIRRIDETTSAAELIDAVRGADADRERLLLLGGGSNLVGSDDGWDGVAVLVRSAGVTAIEQDDEQVLVEVAAGHPWDDLVATSIDAGWSGLEALSGVPGLVGGAVVQNIGAYGSELAAMTASALVLDRRDPSGAPRTWGPDRLRHGYRTSALKNIDRYVVLSVRLRLRRSALSGPVRYQELARALGIALGDAAPSRRVREAVLALRRSKGMVLDPGDHDTWSAGSFFTNPVLPALPAALAHLPADHPAIWPAGAEAVGAGAPAAGVKISAGWLIRQAGFEPGFALPGSAAGLSAKHVLALTNRGGATGAQVRELADHVAATVAAACGVALHPEPILL